MLTWEYSYEEVQRKLVVLRVLGSISSQSLFFLFVCAELVTTCLDKKQLQSKRQAAFKWATCVNTLSVAAEWQWCLHCETVCHFEGACCPLVLNITHFGSLIASKAFSIKKVGFQIAVVRTEAHSIKSQALKQLGCPQNTSVLSRAFSVLQTCGQC